MHIQPEWLKSEKLQYVLLALYDGGDPNDFSGAQAYCVGGCVRDSIAGLPVSDIDIATSRTPQEVQALFTKDWRRPGMRLIPTGVDHGTWTLLWDDESYEITTFRKDVATDGRRATVAFSMKVEEDAQRRDFTMNALYMDYKGKIIDPTGEGLRDLMAREVRFVGSARARCEEDYLRIMRLFRFHAKYGKGPINSDAFWAARDHQFGLKQVSGERIWSEIKKLLACHDPMDALLEMERTGVLSIILPKHGHPLNLAEVMAVERSASMAPGWERRFVALMGYDEDDCQVPFPRSNAEQSYLTTLAQEWNGAGVVAHAAYRTKDERAARDCYVLHVAFNKGLWFDPTHGVNRGMKAECPVEAQDFMDIGIEPGPTLGACLREADQVFLASDLMADKEQILNSVRVRQLI